MKYVVGYSLHYRHEVQVGIEASDSQKAIEKAQKRLDSREIWDDTPEYPLVLDRYEEDEAAGEALDFSIKRTIEEGGGFPKPDASVLQLRADAKARTVARLLVEAYRRGEERGGSVDWSDVDLAYELALDCQL